MDFFFPPAKNTDTSYQMSVAIFKVIQRSIKSLSQIQYVLNEFLTESLKGE